MDAEQLEQLSDEKSKKIVMRVSGVTIAGNLVLSLLKLLAGILGHSGAMISDAVHSASDVFSTVVAVIGINISRKKSDKDHQYGHDRMECVAAIILAVILFATGIGIGINGLEQIIKGVEGNKAPGLRLLQQWYQLQQKNGCTGTQEGQRGKLIREHLWQMHGIIAPMHYLLLVHLSVF